MTFVQALIVVATSRQWPLYQLDINNIFLHGDLYEEDYMQPPSGLSHLPRQVCLLRRALYGIKQAPRAWFEKFSSAVFNLGFIQSEADHTMLIHTSALGCTILHHLDDIVITGEDIIFLQSVKTFSIIHLK